MVNGYQEVEVDFVADNPGLTLFHCHQQLHMDFGFIPEVTRPANFVNSKLCRCKWIGCISSLALRIRSRYRLSCRKRAAVAGFSIANAWPLIVH